MDKWTINERLGSTNTPILEYYEGPRDTASDSVRSPDLVAHRGGDPVQGLDMRLCQVELLCFFRMSS
jgi:hypothetical protein